MFQINWKLKAFLYKVFQSLRLTKSLYFIQKYITRRSKINIQKIDPHWERHESSIRKNNCISLLEIGAGKSLEQNIYFSYIFVKLKWQKSYNFFFIYHAVQMY